MSSHEIKAETVDLSEMGREAPDPFDLGKLVIDPGYIQNATVKKHVTTIKVGKPNRQGFFRIHPSPEYRKTLGIIELKEDRQTYIVAPNMVAALFEFTNTFTLYTGTTRQGVPFLWPVRLPGADGKWMDWHRSADEAAVMAMTKWVRIGANMGLGASEIYEAIVDIAEPKWLELSFQEMLKIAFQRDGLINSQDHQVVKHLLGLA